jgi:hypothetical protein
LGRRRRRCPRGMASLRRRSGRAAVLAEAETRPPAIGEAPLHRARIWVQIRHHLVRRRRSRRWIGTATLGTSSSSLTLLTGTRGFVCLSASHARPFAICRVARGCITWRPASLACHDRGSRAWSPGASARLEDLRGGEWPRPRVQPEALLPRRWKLLCERLGRLRPPRRCSFLPTGLTSSLRRSTWREVGLAHGKAGPYCRRIGCTPSGEGG